MIETKSQRTHFAIKIIFKKCDLDEKNRVKQIYVKIAFTRKSIKLFRKFNKNLIN